MQFVLSDEAEGRSAKGRLSLASSSTWIYLLGLILPVIQSFLWLVRGKEREVTLKGLPGRCPFGTRGFL